MPTMIPPTTSHEAVLFFRLLYSVARQTLSSLATVAGLWPLASKSRACLRWSSESEGLRPSLGSEVQRYRNVR